MVPTFISGWQGTTCHQTKQEAASTRGAAPVRYTAGGVRDGVKMNQALVEI